MKLTPALSRISAVGLFLGAPASAAVCKPPAVSTPSGPTPEYCATNFIADGDFKEADTTSYWQTSGQFQSSSTACTSANGACAKIYQLSHTGTSSILQTLTGMTVSGTYILQFEYLIDFADAVFECNIAATQSDGTTSNTPFVIDSTITGWTPYSQTFTSNVPTSEFSCWVTTDNIGGNGAISFAALSITKVCDN
ncbi:hypothetical protein SBRCBS47491_009682 [Sporothrix bragantina]|uniref:Ig-like domain-containing protein n=1 Tax=Sporothrix bragantina TaxID=671064 RepID=A0ABP0CWN3_9PEZI